MSAVPPPATMSPIEGTPYPLRDLAVAARATGGATTDALMRRVHQIALRYARARLARYGVVDAAQDVAQEVCMAVMSALPTYEERGYPFEAFVYSVTARKVADVQRGIMRSAAPVAQVPDRADETPGPETLAMVGEDAARAMALIDGLPRTQREVLLLRVVMGLSTDETAASLQATPGAVRVAQHRALVRLREQLTAPAGEVAS